MTISSYYYSNHKMTARKDRFLWFSSFLCHFNLQPAKMGWCIQFNNMKKILLSFCILFCLQETMGCDICGCSSGNYFIGTFPQFRKHFFGARYTFRSFHSRVAGDPTQFSKDFYQTTEVWTGVNVGRKWQVLMFIPFNINKQSSDDGIKKNNGLGDVSFIANFNLINTRKGDKHDHMVSQQLWIGGGLKLPTGKFSVNANEIVPDANNQAGSGSVDYILNTMYTLHINDWGINTNLNYKINKDADHYKFGNRLSSGAFIFRSLYNGKTTFIPNMGVLFEHLDANQLNRIKVEDTGGKAFLGSAGLDINFKKVAIGFNAQLPISQNFSNDQTAAGIRGMAHVTFIF